MHFCKKSAAKEMRRKLPLRRRGCRNRRGSGGEGGVLINLRHRTGFMSSSDIKKECALLAGYPLIIDGVLHIQYITIHENLY